jgi:glutathione peroxidase
VKWNFTKFLINKQGKPVQRYGPPTDPKSIEKDILTLMEKASL